MFTICLKFQLTKISALYKVAVAMCKKSSKLIFPTTFSSIYFVASSIISAFTNTFSKFTDWFEQYTLSDFGTNYQFEFGKGKSPYTDKKVKENWIKNSPITYAVNVKTPTLILSNIGDERVPITQSYQYFRVLQDIGTETKFMAFPISGHYPADPLRQKEIQKYILEWLGTYLK